jgi:hypothetical protein
MTRYEMLQRSFWEAKSASLALSRECAGFAAVLLREFAAYLQVPTEHVHCVCSGAEGRRAVALSEALSWGEDSEYHLGVEVTIDDSGEECTAETVVVEFGIRRVSGGFLVKLSSEHQGLFVSPAIRETMDDLFEAVFQLVHGYYRKGLHHFAEAAGTVCRG